MDLSNLSNLAEQMQDAYSKGLGSMNSAAEEVKKDIKPTHEILVNIKLSAKVENHDYKVDSKITFDIDLDSILNAQSEDIAKALEGLNMDLGDDKDAVMEQLGQPRAIGVVKDIDTKTLEISNKDGKVETELNKKGSLLATLKDKKLMINFESVLSFPKNTDVFVAIPSMEKMQKNIVVDTKDITKKIEFNWIEKDKDNLKVEGDLKISKK